MRMVTNCVLFILVLLVGQFGFFPGSSFVNNSEALYWSISSPELGVSQNLVDDIRFGRNVQVTGDYSGYAHQVEPTMAILSTGRILVGWKEAPTHDGPGHRVGFTYSINGGQTFGENILMAPTVEGRRQSDPWLVADANDNAYFVFLDFLDRPDGTIGVAKTLDGGETWLPTVDASNTLGFDDKETACVDADGNLYIVWDEYHDDYQALRFTKSTDGGATFQPASSPFQPFIPYITASDNGTLYVTTDGWDSLLGPGSDKVWITRSDDAGATWTPQIVVTPPQYDEVGIITVVDTDSHHNVYVAYSAGTITDKEIYVVKSEDGGYTWGPPTRVNNVTAGMQRMAEMTIDHNDRIHVAWLDAQHNEWNIYYSYSDDGGTSFQPNIRVSSEGTSLSYWRPGDYFTMRTGPDGKVYIVWTDGRGVDQDIYFATQDLVAPIIEHAPPLSWYQQYPLILVANVTDDNYVETVEIHYQLINSEPRTQIMTQIAPNLYQVMFSETELFGPQLSYYLLARDAAGRETILPQNTEERILVPLSLFAPNRVLLFGGSALVISAVIVFAVWYIRRPTNKTVTTPPT